MKKLPKFKLTPQVFTYVLGGLLVVLIAGGGYGYYLASVSLQADTVKLEQKLAEQQLADDKLSDLEQLSRRYNDLKPVLANLDTALPTVKRESQIGIQLQTLAAESGMTISSITFPAGTALPSAVSQTVKQGDVLAIPVSFELTGSYAQLQQFLQQQEKLSRITNVSSLTISRVDAKGTLKFGITLNAYIKPTS